MLTSVHRPQRSAAEKALARQRTAHAAFAVVAAGLLIWAYLLALLLLSDGLALGIGAEFGDTDKLGRSAFYAVAIGLLSAALVQSSSLATSIIASAVAAGAVGLSSGVQGVVGANIGTSLTALLICLRFSRQRADFERALAGAFMHALFKFFTAFIVIALEFGGGHFVRAIRALAPIRAAAAETGAIAGPAVIAGPVRTLTRFAMDDLGFAPHTAGITLACLGLAMVIGSLLGLMSLMKAALGGSIERALASVMRGGEFIACVVGVLVTVVLQSSTLVTSLMVPLFAAGVLDRRRGFGIIVGANIGTTLKLVLASAATRSNAWDIALAHVIFNGLGGVIWFGVPYLRNVVPAAAGKLARLFASRPRVFAAVVGGVYFVAPVLHVVFG